MHEINLFFAARPNRSRMKPINCVKMRSRVFISLTGSLPVCFILVKQFTIRLSHFHSKNLIRYVLSFFRPFQPTLAFQEVDDAVKRLAPVRVPRLSFNVERAELVKFWYSGMVMISHTPAWIFEHQISEKISSQPTLVSRCCRDLVS